MTLILFVLFNTLSVLNQEVKKFDSDLAQDYLKIHDHQVFYETSGSGIPVVLIHGGYLDQTIWDSQVDFLNRRGFMTIRFDDIGHGKTISGESSVYGYEIIDGLLNELNLSKVNIVGLSWGTMMAVDFTLKFPEKVDKLSLISPGLNGWDYFQDEKAKSNFELRQRARANSDKEQFVEYFQKNWIDGPGCDSLRVHLGIRSRIRAIMMVNIEMHWGEDWSELLNPPAIERLAEINSQTLILTGNLDGQDIQLIAGKLDVEIVGYERIEIDNVAHTLNLENPNKTNHLIYKFLKNP